MADEQSKKVLIIEDDVEYRKNLSAYLSSHGLEVFFADDGQQAMEKLLFHRPRLVVLDLMLPKVKGVEVLKRIREYPDQDVAATLVIVLSNFSDPDEMKACQEFGIEAYLLKSQNDLAGILAVVQEKMFRGDDLPNYQIEDFTRPGSF